MNEPVGRERALEVDLEKSYPDFKIRVKFWVNRGEFFSLIGPSGCGKTTLLRLITGLEEPDRGRIVMDGRELTGIPTARRQIGLVFQDYALFGHLNVRENIEYGLRIQNMAGTDRERRIAELLELFELKWLAARRMDQLSGGERQRVALARALAPQPLILLLDEPFAALDYGLRRRLRAELKELQQRVGFTTIFVTHHQEEALALSHRLAVMENGRILQTGTPREIYEQPSQAFTALFLGDANLIPVLAAATGAMVQVRVEGELWLELPASDGFVSGAYRLMIRPEDLTVYPVEEDSSFFQGPNPLTAKVSQVEYLGYACRLQLKLQNYFLKALLPKAEIGFKIGEPVRVVINPKYARLIPG